MDDRNCDNCKLCMGFMQEESQQPGAAPLNVFSVWGWIAEVVTPGSSGARETKKLRDRPESVCK